MNNEIQNISKLIRGFEKVVFFLDYDGTLTPIVNNPQDAVLEEEQITTLMELNSSDNIDIVIITGRTCSDIQNLINLNDIPILCNHGLYCIKNNNKTTIADITKINQWKKKINLLRTVVKAGIGENFEKIWMENKDPGFAIHTRNANSEQIKEFNEMLDDMVDKLDPDLDYDKGKELIEFRPNHLINKGIAIQWYMDTHVNNDTNLSTLSVGIGDDVTDEDIFSVTNENEGISIFVGSEEEFPKTSAKYQFDNVESVYSWFKMWIKELK